MLADIVNRLSDVSGGMGCCQPSSIGLVMSAVAWDAASHS